MQISFSFFISSVNYLKANIQITTTQSKKRNVASTEKP